MASRADIDTNTTFTAVSAPPARMSAPAVVAQTAVPAAAAGPAASSSAASAEAYQVLAPAPAGRPLAIGRSGPAAGVGPLPSPGAFSAPYGAGGATRATVTQTMPVSPAQPALSFSAVPQNRSARPAAAPAPQLLGVQQQQQQQYATPARYGYEEAVDQGPSPSNSLSGGGGGSPSRVTPYGMAAAVARPFSDRLTGATAAWRARLAETTDPVVAAMAAEPLAPSVAPAARKSAGRWSAPAPAPTPAPARVAEEAFPELALGNHIPDATRRMASTARTPSPTERARWEARMAYAEEHRLKAASAHSMQAAAASQLGTGSLGALASFIRPPPPPPALPRAGAPQGGLAASGGSRR
jgi:hypothetical protein